MNRYRKFFVLLAVLALVTMACSLSSLLGQNESIGEITGQMAEDSAVNSDGGGEENSSQSESETSILEEGYSIDKPAPAGSEVLANDIAVVVTGATRPADDIVAEANQFNEPPEAGEEYLLVEFQMTCTKSGDEPCSFNPFSMLVYGSLEDAHTREFVAGLENEHSSVDFNSGETVSGFMPFSVGQGETDLVLIYQPMSGGTFFFSVPAQ